MTPREVTRRAIQFKYPERLPIIIPTAEYSDAIWISYEHFKLQDNIDEWGCRWEHTELQNMGQVKGHPLENWDKLKNYGFPDPHRKGRFDNIENQLADNVEGKFVIIGSPFTLFERIHYLHGFVNTLQDLVLEPTMVEYLADRILEFQIGIVEEVKNRFYGRIDAFAMTDDWGTQQNTFISVDMFRRIFKPRYKRLFDAIHDAGMFAWLHSCGRINQFIPEFIDIGLDVINLQQPHALGIKEIGRQFAGKICFEAPVDIQRTLPRGIREEIFSDAKLLIQHWGTDSGGFIAGDYGEDMAIGANFTSKQLMLEAFRTHDRWKKKSI